MLATKVYSEMGRGQRVPPVGVHPPGCEDSLRRLQTDHIDLYQMHHVYREATWDEIWQAFEILVQQGKVLYVGSSNFAGWHIAKANEAAKARHFLGLVSEQCIYNLAARAEYEVLPACEDYGMGVIPWSPLWRGLLAGVLEAEGGRRSSGMVQEALEDWRRRSRPTRSSAPSSESRRPRWGSRVLANPVVTSPIIGPRTMEQLDGAMRALDVTLDDATMKRLDEIWPGPAGRRPSPTPGRQRVPRHEPFAADPSCGSVGGRWRRRTATVEAADDLSDEERDVLLKVAEVLRRIEFGTILLVVQDGKVVQIEMAEKFRLR